MKALSREIKFRAVWEGKEYVVETQSKPTDGRGAHNFKGYEIAGGYILRKVTGHPNANSRGYVPEHRLIVEENLSRFLLRDEVVHHLDGDRKNNSISNLKVVTQSEHAGIEHVGRRNPNGTIVAKDPKFDEIKFRLFDEDRNLTSIFTLSKLINTTFRRGKFQFRGRFTGLLDKNGKEIYEGDIVVGVGKTKDNNWQIKRKQRVVEWVSSKNGTGFNIVASPEDYADKTCMRTEIIGNIYEHPHLLTKENK